MIPGASSMASRASQRGVSLIELMVAITIAMLVTLGLIQIFGASRASSQMQEGLSRVDHVLRSVQTSGKAEGGNIFAVQGSPTDPGHLRTHVDSRSAMSVPEEESFRQIETFNQRQSEALQQRQPSFDPQQQIAPGLSR